MKILTLLYVVLKCLTCANDTLERIENIKGTTNTGNGSEVKLIKCFDYTVRQYERAPGGGNVYASALAPATLHASRNA